MSEVGLLVAGQFHCRHHKHVSMHVIGSRFRVFWCTVRVVGRESMDTTRTQCRVGPIQWGDSVSQAWIGGVTPVV